MLGHIPDLALVKADPTGFGRWFRPKGERGGWLTVGPQRNGFFYGQPQIMLYKAGWVDELFGSVVFFRDPPQVVAPVACCQQECPQIDTLPGFQFDPIELVDHIDQGVHRSRQVGIQSFFGMEAVRVPAGSHPLQGACPVRSAVAQAASFFQVFVRGGEFSGILAVWAAVYAGIRR